MDDEEYNEDYFNDDQKDIDKKKIIRIGKVGRRKTAAAGNNVVSLPTAAPMKMVVYHPVSYEDTQNIIDNLKSRKPVIVNIEELEIDCAQRILDFMAGYLCPRWNHLQDLPCIFVVAPTNYDVIGNDGYTDVDVI